MPRFNVAEMTSEQLIEAVNVAVTSSMPVRSDDELAQPSTPFTPLGSYAEDFGSSHGELEAQPKVSR